MFRPFWGSDSLTKLTTFWGNSQPAGKNGRYNLTQIAVFPSEVVNFPEKVAWSQYSVIFFRVKVEV